jgi:hypothetical protein
MKADKMHISDFSPHLFWDIDPKSIILENDCDFIVKKVLLYGLMHDWELLLQFYGLEKIVQSAKSIRELDKRSLSFLSLLSNTPKEEFLCYTTKQSTPPHWNF